MKKTMDANNTVVQKVTRKRATKNTVNAITVTTQENVVISPLNVTVNPVSIENVLQSQPIINETVTAPKRASRKKSFPVVAVVTSNGIQGTLMPEKRKALIAHLPFSSTEVQFHDGPISYDPRPPVQPQPFDEMQDAFDTAATITDVYSGNFNTDINALDEKSMDDSQAFVKENDGDVKQPEVAVARVAEPLPVFTKMDLNLYSREGGVIDVPEQTEVACFWCAHQFDGRPVFLPYDEKDGVWHVYGNFCCPECALAYCLDEKEDQQTRWEKVALLHRLYANVVGGRIYPAPSRTVLKLFGGKLSIEEYRATVRRGKVRIDIHYPPMVSLLATMDTKPIDFYETTIPKSFVPLNSERVKKVEEGLRLKRSKPLKDKESTLDACMNLQIKRGIKGVSGSTNANPFF